MLALEIREHRYIHIFYLKNKNKKQNTVYVKLFITINL